MLHYPSLSITQQKGLPALNATPHALAPKFADSTHKLWLCDTVDGRMVLKVCDHDSVSHASFWQGMNHLFGADFPNSLGQAKAIQTYVATQGLLTLPAVASAQSNRFVLTRYLDGEDTEAATVTDDQVLALAHHISRLHSQKNVAWGHVLQPRFKAEIWGKRLQSTLQTLAETTALTVPASLLNDCLRMASALKETDFVPMMPDLRWDQLRALKGTNKLALIDFDAFVIGPRALDLTLLEYVLTAEQFILFQDTYTKSRDWPDYVMQKPCYQLLLFLMHVLGETDCEAWMQRI